MPSLPWLCVPLAAALGLAPPQGVEARPDWLPGSNLWGSRGIYRLDSAHPLRHGALVFAASAELGVGNGLFVPGDSALLHAERLYVSYAPLPGFEVALSEGIRGTAYHQGFYEEFVQTLGDPTLHLKYSGAPVAALPNVGAGVATTLLIPSAVQNSGLVARALTWTTSALVTYWFTKNVEITANLGYSLNESRNLQGAPDDTHRLTLGIDQSMHHFAYGVGAQTRFDALSFASLAPFIELSGDAALGHRAPQQPVRGSLGIKAYSVDDHLIEVSLGADVRLNGAPATATSYPGIQPWALFIQASVHLFDTAPVIGPSLCSTNSDCGLNQVCDNNMCVIIKEVEHEVIREVVKTQATFIISGKVVDDQTGLAVPDTVLNVGGYEDTPLSVDYKTGGFKSFPLATGNGLVQLRATAPRYRTTVETLARGAAGEEKTVTLRLTRDDASTKGTLSGSVKDGHTGQAIARALLFVPSIGLKIPCDAEGRFRVPVMVGKYDVLITAAGYVTQRKRVDIREGDVIILDIDMHK